MLNMELPAWARGNLGVSGGRGGGTLAEGYRLTLPFGLELAIGGKTAVGTRRGTNRFGCTVESR